MSKAQLIPVTHPFKASILLPGSKSITNRALILAALAKGRSELTNVLFSDDTNTCLSALQALGVNLEVDPQMMTCKVQGASGQFPRPKAELYCHESGTVSRFLLPAAASCPGRYTFSAAPRMQERPIQPLLQALIQQGADFEYHGKANAMPLVMHSSGLLGGEVRVDIKDSSQFLSGLLMAAPYAKESLLLKADTLVSKPYVTMTLEMMRRFGVTVTQHSSDGAVLQVPQGKYHGQVYEIEPDASTASYFFAAAAITGSEVEVQGLHMNALQRDVQFVRCLEKMGCQVLETQSGIQVKGPKKLKGLGEIDLAGYTDTFMTLAVTAVFADSPTTIASLRHTRLQESDRVSAIATGLSAVGIQVSATEDSLTVYPGAPKSSMVDACNDHRIAMSLALLGLKVPGVIVMGAEAVNKTCPDYFERMHAMVSHKE